MPGQYDESKHQRDQGGRFSSTGGGGEALKAFSKNPGGAWGGGSGGRTAADKAPPGDGGKLKGWATSYREQKPGEAFGWQHGGKEVGDQGKLETQMGKRRWENVGPKSMQAESWMGNYDKHPWQGGKASAERDASVHQPIIHKAIDNVKAPEPGEQKMAIFTMGGPGSGKSSMMRGLDDSKFVHVDPDAVREQLPEYQKSIKGPMTYKGASGMTQAEAGDVASKIRDEAMRQGKHVIIDGTGADPRNPMAAMEQFRKAGYKIHLAYAHLDEEQGMKRIAGRAEATGRDVDAQWAHMAYQKIPHNFQEMASHADTFAVHSTGEKGSPMMWSKGEDGQENGDQKFIGDFKNKFFPGQKKSEDASFYGNAPSTAAPAKSSGKGGDQDLYKDAPRSKASTRSAPSPEQIAKNKRDNDALYR